MAAWPTTPANLASPIFEGQQPWSVPVDIALPCATQNELDVDAARQLIANGVKAVAEGANMPTTIAATDLVLGS